MAQLLHSYVLNSFSMEIVSLNSLGMVILCQGLVERITTVISQILEQGEFASVQEFLDTVAHMLSGGELHADIRDSCGSTFLSYSVFPPLFQGGFDPD